MESTTVPAVYELEVQTIRGTEYSEHETYAKLHAAEQAARSAPGYLSSTVTLLAVAP